VYDHTQKRASDAPHIERGTKTIVDVRLAGRQKTVSLVLVWGHSMELTFKFVDNLSKAFDSSPVADCRKASWLKKAICTVRLQQLAKDELTGPGAVTYPVALDGDVFDTFGDLAKGNPYGHQGWLVRDCEWWSPTVRTRFHAFTLSLARLQLTYIS